MSDLVEWLGRQIDEDARIATEASRRFESAPVAGGVHWHWVDPESDTPVTPDPSRSEFLTDEAENFGFSLRSVERFPTEHVGLLPQFAIAHAMEVPVAAACHIAAHDPARVLREIEAKRRILARHVLSPAEGDPGRPWDDADDCLYDGEPWPCPDLRDLALSYADRPGCRDEWRP
ncbi:DUF6221 family protein [Streptomyces indicus]|uniref:Uncharacterized protein n=1 Tax=Streptomyces indicus TaxID=417292 RepID=A0A1G8TGS9_9ACTN|nr:DUF6221 family protein [Streptomyces indicus]SDJ39880.1 hypothetical protein SAMN05421806_101219 [Streptomyces indicus]